MTVPSAPITKNDLAKLLAVLFVYKQLIQKEPGSSPEKTYEMQALDSLITNVTQAMMVPLQTRESRLFLSTHDIHILKSALATELDLLQKRLSSHKPRKGRQSTLRRDLQMEIKHLSALMVLITSHFPTTQD